jgi:serine/threonine-protein kinase/endoribonuclease IRE1
MVLVTLSGQMIAIDPQTATHRWTKQHDPVVKTNGNEKLNFSTIFLPDPVTGRLYNMKTNDGDEFELSRMDFTIPDLVLKAPFMSEEKILYTGRKLDSWFMINSMTGECKTVMGEETREF